MISFYNKDSYICVVQLVNAEAKIEDLNAREFDEELAPLIYANKITGAAASQTKNDSIVPFLKYNLIYSRAIERSYN